jgi:site-specific recombinase XerD
MERKGKSPNTIDGTRKALIELAKRANLEKIEEVELAIARYKLTDPRTKQLTDKPATNNWKAHLCTAYNHYCKLNEIKWEMPTYKIDEKSIQIPSPEKCAMLLAGTRGTLSIKIDISTQTGLRPIEIQGEKGLKAKDIHPDQKTITAVNTKGCNARPPLPISIELVTKLQTYIIKNNIKPEEILFKGKSRNYGDHFRRFKKRLAKQLADPTIEAIRLYDLRHYYITNKLRKIQNAEIVRQLVGHKGLNTTQKYFHLLTQDGEWIVESTTDQKRADELLRQDFTYVLTTPDGYMKFRKLK